MAKSDDWVLPLFLGAGALGALYLWNRQSEASAGGPESQAGGGTGSSAGEAALGGAASPFSFYDPATGLPVSPGDVGFSTVTGPDGLPRDVTGPFPSLAPEQPVALQFSPDFERELLRQNEDTNRQIVAETRKQTTAANVEAAAFGGAALVTGGTALVKVASKTPALVRAAAPALGTAVRVGGPVGAGIALGLTGVAALDKTGALDEVQKFGQSTIGKTPEPVQATVRTVALPLTVVGGVAVGLVGRGDVGENVRSAFRGTYVDKGIKGVQGWLK